MHTSRLPLALAACVLAFAATPALGVHAQPVERVSMIVKYGDLNLSTHEGAKAMYQRIKNTARGLCGNEPDNTDLGAHQEWRNCVNGAVDNAVGRLDAPMVTAFNGRSATFSKLADAR